MTNANVTNIHYPLLIDGGLSNVLEKQGCQLNHSLWSARLIETSPESIIQAHLAYLESGAQCLITSSYQASVAGFSAMGHDILSAEKLIIKSVELAEIAIDRFEIAHKSSTRSLIAASIGPYGAYLADGSEYYGNYGVTDEVLRQFHYDRMRVLDDTNADFFACETIPSYQEAKVLAALLSEMKKTAWISFSCKDEAHINDGTAIQNCVELFAQHPSVFAIGINCTAPKHVSGLIKAIKTVSRTKKIVVYPNSGEAYNATSKTWLGVADPASFVTMAEEWLELGADIIGGCCQIGPEHIGRLKEVMAN